MLCTALGRKEKVPENLGGFNCHSQLPIAATSLEQMFKYASLRGALEIPGSEEVTVTLQLEPEYTDLS